MILNSGSSTGGGPPLRVLPRRASRARTRLELGRDGPDLTAALSGTGGAAGSAGVGRGGTEGAEGDGDAELGPPEADDPGAGEDVGAEAEAAAVGADAAEPEAAA
ncbi:hypothetical protein ABH926_002368 [Catenulispora sp. GP43]|uniref:hypothetical protein n=1 Tax=Catenulispora sp. GP43 TaxID=3156263 RepID=UPI0035193721